MAHRGGTERGPAGVGSDSAADAGVEDGMSSPAGRTAHGAPAGAPVGTGSPMDRPRAGDLPGAVASAHDLVVGGAPPGGPVGDGAPDAGGPAGGALPAVLTHKAPPVAELLVSSVAAMLAGGVYLAAHLPRRPSLAPAVGLVAAGVVLTAAALVVLSRVRVLAWARFFQVMRWALAAYAVIAGILAYVFVLDHTTGATLAVLVATLVVFAVDVPTVLAFTVAWYQQPRD